MEREKVRLLFLHHFLQGLALSFLHVTALKLFFKEFENPARLLAMVFLAAGALQLISGRIYAWVEHRYKPQQVLNGVVVFLLILLVTVFAAFYLYKPLGLEKQYLIFGVLSLYYLAYQVSSLELWGLTALVFDVRQSKRLFGIFSSGDVPAKIMGYLSYLALYKILYINGFDSKKYLPLLLTVSVLAIAASFRVLKRILEQVELPEIDHHHESHESGEGSSFVKVIQRFFKSPFILVLGLLSFAGIYVRTFVEYLYLVVTDRYLEPESVVLFIGIFYGGVHLALAFLHFFTNRIILKLGVGRSLLILPAALLLVMSAWGASLLFHPGDSVHFYFGLAVMVTWVMGYYAVHNPLFMALFQPMKEELRLHGHTVVKGLINPIGMLAGGLVLVLGLAGQNHLDNRFLMINLLAALLLWLFLVFRTNISYVQQLRQAIGKRWFGRHDLILGDPQTLETIARKLDSDHPDEVIYALELLQKADPDQFRHKCTALLQSEHSDVAIYCLKAVQSNAWNESLQTVELLARYAEAPFLKQEAVRTFCQLSERTDYQREHFLESADLAVQQSAIIGMLRQGGIESVVLAGQRLLDLIQSEKNDDRKIAAELLGELGVQSYYQPILRFFEFDDHDLRRKAIEASARIRNERFVPYLLKFISHRKHLQEANRALIRIGDSAVESIVGSIEAGGDVDGRMVMIDCLAKIGSERAVAYLANADFGNVQRLERARAEALLHSSYQSQGGDFERWQRMIQERMDRAYQLFYILHTEKDLSDTFREALRLEWRNNLDTAFCYISFDSDRETILNLREHLLSDSGAYHATALETVENTLPGSIARRLIPMFEAGRIEDRLAELERNVGKPEYRNIREYADIIALEGNSVFNRWTLVNALLLAEEPDAAVLQKYRTHESRILKEAAELRALSAKPIRLNGQTTFDEFKPQLQRMESHASQSLLEIEKVIVLKSTSLFHDTPESVLVDVARILKEVRHEAGVQIFDKDDPGNCMYIIYDGKVRIHDGDTTFVTMGSREFFGEFALLDSEARSAAATTVEETLLLRLDQENFFELMSTRIEVAKGILKTLTRRLRLQNEKLRDLSSTD